MDLHIVPGITAKGAAEAHLQDLLIQSQYNCTCMTYWVDEAKNSAFCLIDAPNPEAVRELHNKAHGLMTHQIIEVNSGVVESFLGRIYDPESAELLEGKLKVFNDPAFRVLVMVKSIDRILLTSKVGKQKCDELFSKYQEFIGKFSREFEGKIAEQYEDISILSFVTTLKAVGCAIALRQSFADETLAPLALNISINAGVPVTQHARLFGEAIKMGERLFMAGARNQIIASPIIKEITHKYFFEQQDNSIFTLSELDEKRLNKLVDILEAKSGESTFTVDVLGKELSLSKSSLNRVILALLETTPNVLINEFRLTKALSLLRKSGDSIAEISFTTGFTSPSYFSKCFQKRFDITPTKYLEMLNNK